MAARELPLWRSLLYVPANVDRFVERAHTRGADVVQLDLEDSVPPEAKDDARRALATAAERVGRGGADVAVRINRPWRLAMKDLEAAVCPAVGVLALPKVAGGEHVRMLDEVVGELEAERGMQVGATRFIAIIETADAFFRMGEIAAASPRVAALTLGSEDFALSVGMEPEGEGLIYPKQRLVIAARAAGALPLGLVGTVARHRDLEEFRAVVRRSRALGFRGASAIHPDQVRVLNEEFSPTPQEVEHARRVIATYDAARAEGRGSAELDGALVDAPVVERARAVLGLHERIRRKAAPG